MLLREVTSQTIGERHPFARKVNDYLIGLCIEARRSANDPHQGRQNEANEGHGQGPPVKQCHAKQRQAENHKFHGCASAAVASENKDR